MKLDDNFAGVQGEYERNRLYKEKDIRMNVYDVRVYEHIRQGDKCARV